MSGEMGTFRVDIEIENPVRPGRKRALRSVLVDSGAELSCIPAEVLESLGIERYSRCGFDKPTGRSWSDGPAPRSCTPRANGPPTTSSSGSRAT